MKKTKFEKELLSALKSNGYVFPTSVREVKNFNKLYGDTNLEMPDKFKSSDPFIKKFLKNVKSKLTEETIISSMAARKGESISGKTLAKIKALHKEEAKKKENNRG